ncbi:MAG: hypothetical protein J6G98_05520 [Bacilli bacterium]|nr:hypothetical protein [Bacilli bacterium]
MDILAKIERNANVMNNAPEGIKAKCINDLKWARELVGRLQQLDYDIRNNTIKEIHKVLDNDYKLMGYSLEENHKTL